MKKGIIIPFALLISIFALGFIMLRSTERSKPPCKESMEQCCKKKNTHPSAQDPMWETLSHQLFSFAGQVN